MSGEIRFYTSGPREIVRYTAAGEWICGSAPMTDLQTITLMLGRAEIKWSIEPTRENTAAANGNNLPPGTTVTVARADEDNAPIYGYLGFYAEFYFDAEGALVGMGAWE